MKVLREDVFYKMFGSPFNIVKLPKGTPVIPADNLEQPNYALIEYWVEPWEGMAEEEESHMRTYGFGVSADDVEEV